MAANDKDAISLEKKHVFQVYEKIASHFSQTRYKPWPRVAHFLNSLPCGSLVYDIGCGNGKYLSVSPRIATIGCDTSWELLQICGKRGQQVVAAEARGLPFKHRSGDGCISIAVIHHLASEERRLDAVQQMVYLLRVGGKALIYVWAFEQERQGSVSNYIKKHSESGRKERDPESVSETTSEASGTLPVHCNRTKFEQQDVLVPWKRKHAEGETESSQPFLRYYHVFREKELEELVERIAGVEIRESYYDQGNWCILIERIK